MDELHEMIEGESLYEHHTQTRISESETVMRCTSIQMAHMVTV